MSTRYSGYERKNADCYGTPPWVTEALIPHLPPLPRHKGGLIWEPAAGDGAMARVLRRHFEGVVASDIAPPPGTTDWIDRYDFLCGDEPLWSDVDAIITNPPFGREALRFIERALEITSRSRGVVAMLLRCQYDHARGYSHVFGGHPAFSKRIALTRRIVWFVEANGKPKASPSDNHMWCLWDWRKVGPPIVAYAPIPEVAVEAAA